MRKILLLVKAAALLFVLVFYVFWYVPSMRSQLAFRHALDKASNSSQDCWQEKFQIKDYDAADRCLQPFEQWEKKNNQPHPEWNWPWKTWKETTP